MKYLAMALGCILVAGCGSNGDEAVSNIADDEAAEVAVAEEVAAKDISAAFQENEVRAKMQYDDKKLRVSGTVKDITLDFMDDPVIALIGANEVQGMGMSEDGKFTDVNITGLTQEDAAVLEKGEEMTFLCSGVGEAMGGAQLDDCSIAK